jgi:hypothetical protein
MERREREGGEVDREGKRRSVIEGIGRDGVGVCVTAVT